MESEDESEVEMDWETLIEDEKNKINWESEDCYWRPIWSSRINNPTIACLQYFDEPDYDHEMYLTDLKFPNEELARKWLDDWIKKVDWDTYRRWEIKGKSRG